MSCDKQAGKVCILADEFNSAENPFLYVNIDPSTGDISKDGGLAPDELPNIRKVPITYAKDDTSIINPIRLMGDCCVNLRCPPTLVLDAAGIGALVEVISGRQFDGADGTYTGDTSAIPVDAAVRSLSKILPSSCPDSPPKCLQDPCN